MHYLLPQKRLKKTFDQTKTEIKLLMEKVIESEFGRNVKADLGSPKR